MLQNVSRDVAALVSFALCVAACVSPVPTSEGEEDTTDDGASSASGEFVSVIDHDAWTQLETVEDPLADHRPAMVECGIAGWYVENDALEVDTNLCNYLAVGQPSLAVISKGRRVRLGFYHFDLRAPEEAIAHLAVLVHGEVLWEQEIAIPGDAMVYELEFESPMDAAVGDAVVFHLHNHGQNTWALQEILAEQ